MAHVYNSQLDAFELYHKQQEIHSSSTQSGPALPALGHALAGSSGTAISTLLIYPLNLIITRLQVQRQLRATAGTAHKGEYAGVLDAAKKILANEGGIAALYSGVLQDTGKSIADSFLFFLFYNYLRQNRLRRHGEKATTLPVLDELLVGALAGACSKFFTTPLANIVTRKQTSRMISSRSSSSSQHAEPSVAAIAAQIREEKGLQGFWSGYSASLVLTLNPSLTFFLYETFKRTLLPRARREDPGARVTFLMAACSKAIASTVTYPFSLAKARSQVGGKVPVRPEDAQTVKNDVSQLAKDGGQNIGEKKGEGRKAGRDIKATAKRSTVFSTILEIYKTEGLAALYEGVLGEICKGFFSHGITMLVKEAAHKVIIQLYFLILKLLKRFPEQVEDLAGDARDKVGGVVESVNGAVGDAYQGVKEQAGNLAERAQVLSNNATETAGNAYEGAKSQAGSLTERAQLLGNNATEATKAGLESVNAALGQAYEGSKKQAGGIIDKAQVMGSNATEAAKAGDEYAKSEAQKVFRTAQETVGKNMEETGRNLRTGTAVGGDK